MGSLSPQFRDLLQSGSLEAWWRIHLDDRAYDPQLNLTYWGVGDVGPDYAGDQRPGDNLYTASVVALDADTGTLRWHYQFTPHDIYNYDSLPMRARRVDNWGPPPQHRGLGQSQRQLLRAGARDREVPARTTVREGQLDERF